MINPMYDGDSDGTMVMEEELDEDYEPTPEGIIFRINLLLKTIIN